MQSYDDFRLIPTKQTISGREACGAYTKNAAETANHAITVAKYTCWLKKNSYLCKKVIVITVITNILKQ